MLPAFDNSYSPDGSGSQRNDTDSRKAILPGRPPLGGDSPDMIQIFNPEETASNVAGDSTGNRLQQYSVREVNPELVQSVMAAMQQIQQSGRGNCTSGDRMIDPVPSDAFPDSMPIRTVLDEYLLPELSHTGADHKKKLNKVDKCLSAFIGRPAIVRDMADQKLLNRWLASLPWSAPTINGRRTYARILQNYVFGKSAALSLQMRRQREAQNLPVAWKMDEMEIIVQACLDFDKWIQCDEHRVHVGQRTLLCLRLIFDTGLRINALLGRQRSDVVAGVLCVPSESQKTKKEQRFKLSSETLEWIERLPNVRGRLIPHTYTQERIDKPFTNFLTQILKTTGLPVTRKHKWHCLRRVHATQLARAVSMEAAQRALGHSSIKTTERYVDTTQLPQVTAVDVIPKLSSASSVTSPERMLSDSHV